MRTLGTGWLPLSYAYGIICAVRHTIWVASRFNGWVLTYATNKYTLMVLFDERKEHSNH